MLMLRKMFEIEKASLFFATNGQEALDIVKASPEIQIVLMDLKMPVMDGFKAIELIRQVQPDIYIIAQSAYASSDDHDKASESGCNDFIVKPIQMELLLMLIHKHIENS
jgi:CheY-like chemotaxis protein